MGFFDRLRGHREPPDVVALRLAEDVPGLVRALGAEDAAIVADAARALANIARYGETDRARAQARAADVDLLRTLARFRTAGEGPITAATILDTGAQQSAAWAAIDALGAVGSQAALPVLRDLVRDSSADPYLRMYAARALGRIGDPESVPILASILEEPRITRHQVVELRKELAAAAGQGLLASGERGAAIVREAALAGNAAAEEALRATQGSGAPEADRALAVIDELEALRSAQRQAEATARAAAEQEQREARARRYPAAAKLAALIGLADSVTEAGSIRPGFRSSYDQAVLACRRLGLAVREHEEPADDGMADMWATVAFEGRDIVVEGGRWFRDVLY